MRVVMVLTVIPRNLDASPARWMGKWRLAGASEHRDPTAAVKMLAGSTIFLFSYSYEARGSQNVV